MDSVASEAPALLKMIVALVFVLGLMGGLALIMRRLGLSGRISAPGEKARLKLIESIPLDNRRRLVLVQRDDVQHLVIFGPNDETVIETGIAAPDNS